MKNKLFLLIICALLAYCPIYCEDTKAREQQLQENLVRLASEGQPYDDATLSDIANQVKQIGVSFELNNSNGEHNEALWKEFVGNVITFYSRVMHAETKETVFDTMIECLTNLGGPDSHGRVNVLLGTNQAPHQDDLESLEQR